MKLSLLTALFLSWLYGTVAGLLLPRGPLSLSLYGLILLAIAGAAHLVHRAITYHLALAEFRREIAIARQQAARIVGGY